MKRIERPKSLTELVFGELKNDIVSGELKMGDALSEAKIATRLNVSRTPVREAFARLELEGLVTTEPQRGTYVFTMALRELRDICDTRVCLEPAAMRAAFEKNKPDLVRDIARVVKDMRKAREAGDDAGYLRLDTAFHQTLFDNADNTFLNEAYQTIASKMAALRNRLGAHPDHMAKSYEEHIQMSDLLEAGDIDRATEILITHIGRKEGSYWNR